MSKRKRDIVVREPVAMKLGDLYASPGVKKLLLEQKLPARLKFRLAEIVKLIEGVEEARVACVQRWGEHFDIVPDPDGTYTWPEGVDTSPIEREVNGLMDEEVSVHFHFDIYDIVNPPYTIIESLNAIDLESLRPFITNLEQFINEYSEDSE